jgi:serine/threonine protein kinase
MLDKITESFSSERKLGSGTFAIVYYGSLYLCDDPPQDWPDRIAVKVDKYKYEDEKMDFNSSKKKSEWMKSADQAELKFCGSYHHKNLCRLFGFSVDGPSRCLVFEYCPGGSVKDRLAGDAIDKGASRPFPPLGVGHRFRICAQLGRALVYLHCGTSKAVFHRDVKVRETNSACVKMY